MLGDVPCLVLVGHVLPKDVVTQYSSDLYDCNVAVCDFNACDLFGPVA